ncbi:hypothetical protein PBY51_024653 [Eleginops maclovinus]|nr:hypothetical protein PBY51_024653 [Eleginops maclovinus]
MEADGGHALHRERRTGHLAVIVVQNVLVTACLAVTLYVFWVVQNQTPRAEQAVEDNVHIQFYETNVLSQNGTVQFIGVKSSNMMSLANGKKDKIYINCTGPYVLYMNLCYTTMNEQEFEVNLQLQVPGRLVSNFSLNAERRGQQLDCRGLQSTAYLRRNEEASLHVYTLNGFVFKTVTVGLNYLLGSRCDY